MNRIRPKIVISPVPGEHGGLPAYRHYRLDGAGTISGAEWLDAADDDDAVRQVRERNLAVDSEIWYRNRLVARLEAAKPR